MELLDRYLEAVRKHLPWKRQDDLLAELRADLEAQLEDREAELGRPLTKEEASVWLKQIGSPLRVAARYQPQQYLIGPALFPIYRLIVRAVCFWITVGYLVVATVLLVLGPHSASRLAGMLFNLFWEVGIAAGIVTLVFALIEVGAIFNPENFPDLIAQKLNWSPNELPPVPSEQSGGKRPRSFATAVAEVVFGGFFLVWWLLTPQYPFLLLGPGAALLDASPFHWSAVWVQFYWWVVALNLVQLIWRTMDLFRGAWQGRRQMQNAVLSLLGLAPLILLLSAPGHVYFLLKHPEADQMRWGAQLTELNQGVYTAFSVVLAIVILQLVWKISRFGLESWKKSQIAANR